jgi:hypothetical protein
MKTIRWSIRETLRTAFLLGLIVQLVSFEAQAFTVSASEDAQVRIGRQSTKNFGARRLVTVRATAGGFHGYVKFHLGELPIPVTGATIAKAVLRIPLARVTRAGTIDIARVDGVWSEETITGATPPTLGAAVGQVSLERSDAGQIVSADVTDLVRAWIDGVFANHGLALLPANGVRTDIHSRESRGARAPMRIDLVLLGRSAPVTSRGYANMAVVAADGGDYADPRDAMANVSSGDNWCGVPSAGNRCLIRIMPGVYDLDDARGGSALTMVPFVSIDHSMVSAETATVNMQGSTGSVMIGGTRLIGGTVVGSVLVSCAGVYDETNTFFTNTCP